MRSAIAATLVILTLSATSASFAADDPRPPRAQATWTDRARGISGLSLLPGVDSLTTHILVHDAKTKDDPPAPASPLPRVSWVQRGLPERVDVVDPNGAAVLAEPNPLATRLKRLPFGAPMALLERGDAWTKIRDEGGAEGWARASELGVAMTGGVFTWPAGAKNAELPNDLEAVSAIPGMPGHAILMESRGRLFHVSIAKDADAWTLKIVRPAPPPLPRWAGKDYEKEGEEVPENEGFTLTKLNGRLIALWSERGTRTAAATVFFAPFDVERGVDVDELGAVSLHVPYPPGSDVRDVSDVVVDSRKRVWIASADDEGDDGPFRSGIYRLGSLKASGSGIVFDRERELVEVRRIDGHKIEGLEIVGDGLFALGSDDENKGGWLRLEAPGDDTLQVTPSPGSVGGPPK